MAEVEEKELRGAQEAEIEQVKGEHVAVTESQQVRAALKGKEAQEVRVDSHVLVLHHAVRTVMPDMFTRDTFEDALDKVSRPVKGKYADVPYSSEDLIREKRTEAQLEDR
jgi:hypothetical protein